MPGFVDRGDLQVCGRALVGAANFGQQVRHGHRAVRGARTASRASHETLAVRAASPLRRQGRVGQVLVREVAAQVLPQHGAALGTVRQPDPDVSVEPPAAQKRRVELFGVVASGGKDDPAAAFYAVDFGQQAVDHLYLPIRVSMRHGSPVREESTSSMKRRLGEQALAAAKAFRMALSKSPWCAPPVPCHSPYEPTTKGTWQVAASARAKIVFPHPDGPGSRQPRSAASHSSLPAWKASKSRAALLPHSTASFMPCSRSSVGASRSEAAAAGAAFRDASRASQQVTHLLDIAIASLPGPTRQSDVGNINQEFPAGPLLRFPCQHSSCRKPLVRRRPTRRRSSLRLLGSSRAPRSCNSPSKPVSASAR